MQRSSQFLHDARPESSKGGRREKESINPSERQKEGRPRRRPCQFFLTGRGSYLQETAIRAGEKKKEAGVSGSMYLGSGLSVHCYVSTRGPLRGERGKNIGVDH